MVDDGTPSRTTLLSERAAVGAGFFAIAFVNASSFVGFVVRRYSHAVVGLPQVVIDRQ